MKEPVEELVSEAVVPDHTSGADLPYRGGEPVVPGRFRWRGREYSIAAVLDSWKELSRGSPAMPERYVRRHWYRIVTGDGLEMKLYVERRGRARGRGKPGWWLYSVIRR